MKLISMTDFVLSKELILDNDNYKESDNAIDSIFKYANFLKQPLTLGMFVPCNYDGNFLTKPPIREEDYEDDLIDAVIDKRYEIAQSKVLFSGFTLIEIVENEYIHVSNGTLTLFFHNSNEIESNTNNYNGWVSIVEDFINSNYHLDLAVSF